MPPDDLRWLSRIRIEYGPGRCRVIVHRAGMEEQSSLGVHEGGIVRPIPRGPVSLSNQCGVTDRNPPITLMQWDCRPDLVWSIETDDLDGQIEELEASGLVGSLNVEHWRDRVVITASGGTQQERDAWLRALLRDEPRPPAMPRDAGSADALTYVEITGNTYQHRLRILRMAARDKGFARWSKAQRAWRAKLSATSIERLRKMGLDVAPILTAESDDAPAAHHA